MAMTIETNWNRYESLKVRLGEMRQGFDSAKGRQAIDRAKEAVEQDHRDAMARGLDRNGVPLIPVKPETMETRGGSGPPLAPRGAASRAVANFAVTEARQGNQVVLRAGFTGDTAWLRFHKTGTRTLPVRDIIGIRPAGRQRVRDIVRDFQRSLVRGDR